jgi:hypothetical protein
MNRRLPNLLHQRDLVREHLKWLEEEIAAESTAPTAAVVSAEAASGEGRPPSSPPVECFVPEPDIKELHGEVRRGCLGYFVLAAAVLAALVGYIYWRY